MIQVRNYSINPTYKDFLDKKGVKIKTDLLDTDFVYVEDFQTCLKQMREKFPGYTKGIQGIKAMDWEIYASSSGESNIPLIATLDHIKGSITRTLIQTNQYDNILISGYPLLSLEDFDISLLESYKDFGFSNPLDFVMTLSAIVSSEVFVHNETEATWVNNGVKTILTADMQGDTQLEQLDMSESINVSHIGSIVPFKPMERKLLRSYFHTESSLLAIFLGYIEQRGATKDIFGEGYLKLKDELEQGELKYGPYGNAGDYDMTSLMSGYELFKYKIQNFSQNPTHFIGPNPVSDPDGKGYFFYIGFDGNLYIYEGQRGNQLPLMKFDLLDAEKMVRGIISNTKKGIGRTGIGEITELINHINREGKFPSEI